MLPDIFGKPRREILAKRPPELDPAETAAAAAIASPTASAGIAIIATSAAANRAAQKID